MPSKDDFADVPTIHLVICVTVSDTASKSLFAFEWIQQDFVGSLCACLVLCIAVSGAH